MSSVIENLKEKSNKLNLVEFPIKRDEVDAFKYRVSDVVKSISNKQIKAKIKVDFQKQLW